MVSLVIVCIAYAIGPEQEKVEALDPSFRTIVSVKIAESPSTQELLDQPSTMRFAMSRYYQRQVITVARYGKRGTGLTLAHTLTAEQIDSFLAKRNSPMAGLGRQIVAAGKRHNVNPALILAIAGAETNFGKEAIRHNAWGWGHKHFSNWEEAIDVYALELSQKYLKNRSCQTIEDISRTYCRRRSSWRKSVRHFYSFLMDIPASSVN